MEKRPVYEALLHKLTAYQPCNDQEKRDQELILSLLQTRSGIFTREESSAHMTASAWTVNEAKNRVLMVYHRIYDSWSWMGGHADGQEDLLAVAVREVREESGVTRVKVLQDEPFSLEVLAVDGHEKNGVYVSSHLHLNITYLLQADEQERLSIKEDENSGVRWFGLDEAVQASAEPWFRQRIYTKLNKKLLIYR